MPEDERLHICLICKNPGCVSLVELPNECLPDRPFADFEDADSFAKALAEDKLAELCGAESDTKLLQRQAREVLGRA